MSKVVPIRLNRNLIQSNFDGYKLSLDPLPLISHRLPTPPYKAAATDEQYSLLHAEIFTMQNLLQMDPWSCNVVYYVSITGDVVRTAFNNDTGNVESSCVVFHVAEDSMTIDKIRPEGGFNYSFRFISQKYCVLCDGINRLFLFDTGHRTTSTMWQQIAITTIGATEEQQEEEEHNYHLYDCRLDATDASTRITCALGRVKRSEARPTGDPHIHSLVLHWAQWSLDSASDNWTFSILNTLEGSGSLYYCAFEPHGLALIISSNRPFKFRSLPDIDLTEEAPVEEAKDFAWFQADDDVVVKFPKESARSRSDYTIKSTSTTLTIRCEEEMVVFDKNLFARIDPQLTTWTWTNDDQFLQVTLVKDEPSLHWLSLVADGTGPMEGLTKDDNSDQPPVRQQQISNLDAQMEECDFPVGNIEDENKIMRYHLPSLTMTHCVYLGTTPPLFSTLLQPGQPPAVVTREDVDACIWTPALVSDDNDTDWCLHHDGTLPAFGYIQASKRERKFMACSPDFSYAVICEPHRHVFVYKATNEGANNLRNRNGGRQRVNVGKQYLLTLDNVGEILGVATSTSMIILLTERSLLCLRVN